MLLAAFVVAPAAGAGPLPLPDTIAAVGDSITTAASTGGSLGVDAPANSWSTGTNPVVNSHYQRLLAAGAPIGRVGNLAVSGAKMSGLAEQMAKAGPLAPDYLTVLIGGNDLCTSTADSMTLTGDFEAQFTAAMGTLRTTGGAATQVYVVSIPRVFKLWELFKGNGWARFIWSIGNVCQSLLANPTSMADVDVARRDDVDTRNGEFNAVLAAVCQASQPCLYDGGAAFNTAFTAADVSGDYFHPSTAGQAKLAAVSWASGYQWQIPNRPPVASFTSSCAGLTCTFTDTSTDPDADIVTRTWEFGGSGSGPPAAYTYAAEGDYTVKLTVVDADDASSISSQVVQPRAPVAQQMRVSALTSTTSRSWGSWRTTVTISVVRTDGTAASNARVSATWTRGSSDTCTTGSTGRCTVTSDWLSRSSVPSVTMTVANVTHATLPWDSAGSVKQITVNRP